MLILSTSILTSRKKSVTGSVQASDSTLQKGKSKKKKPAVELSDEQKKVLDMVVNEGKNVFFTGSAGPSIHPLYSPHIPLTQLNTSS